VTWLLNDPFTALALGILAVTGLLLAALAALIAASASVLRRRRGHIEALIDATRENMPDHVPDAWVKEHGR
jgi:hypothetical protein